MLVDQDNTEPETQQSISQKHESTIKSNIMKAERTDLPEDEANVLF